MEQHASPCGLEQWVAFLRDKPLPVHARTSLLLRQLLKQPATPLNQLQPVVASDPVFSMHAMALANRLNRNPDTDVSTTELAVSTLGSDRLQELAETLPIIKINHASVPHKQYFHAIANSYHAATQAADLCRFPSAAVINDVRTAALVYGVGHWALWRYAPRQMSDIKIRIYEQGADVVLAEHDVLGCTIQEISRALAECWQLSRLAVEALDHATSPDAQMLDKLHRFADNPEALDEADVREVKQLLNTTFYPVKLANWLSLTVPYGWEKTKAIRLLEIITDYAQQDADAVMSRLHRNCVQASREYHVAGIMTPAAMMILQPSDQVLSYRLEGTTAPANSSPAPAPAKPAAEAHAKTEKDASDDASQLLDRQGYEQVLARLATIPPPYADTNQLLTDLLRGVRLGLGLQRCCVFRVRDGELTPLKQSGFSNTDHLPRFTQSLSVPSLFKKLSQRPLAVWINDQNRDRIWAELPERFKAICHQHSFALTSLFIQNQPVFYIYADRVEDNQVVSDFDFNHFKQLAVACSRSLNQLPPPTAS